MLSMENILALALRGEFIITLLRFAETAGSIKRLFSILCIRGMFSESHSAKSARMKVRMLASYLFCSLEYIMASVAYLWFMESPNSFLQSLMSVSLETLCNLRRLLKLMPTFSKPSLTLSLRDFKEVSMSLRTTVAMEAWRWWNWWLGYSEPLFIVWVRCTLRVWAGW